jgi:PAS domain S-box-containing protein
MKRFELLDQLLEPEQGIEPVELSKLIPKILMQYANMLFEERFNGGFELLCCLDMNGYLKYVCPNHKEILGYESSELVGINAMEILHPGEIEFLESRFREISIKKHPIEAAYRIKHKNGEWLNMNSICTPFLVDGEVAALVNFSKLSAKHWEPV